MQRLSLIGHTGGGPYGKGQAVRLGVRHREDYGTGITHIASVQALLSLGETVEQTILCETRCQACIARGIPH